MNFKILISSILVAVVLFACFDSATNIKGAEEASVSSSVELGKSSSLIVAASSSSNLGTSSNKLSSSSSLKLSSSTTLVSSSVMDSSAITISSSDAALSSNAILLSSSTEAAHCSIAGNCGTFTDKRDGKVYKWTMIGTQSWMAENLAYLPRVNVKSDSSSTVAKYNVYGYDDTSVSDAKASSYYTTYGVLYNWTAAMAGAASSPASPSGVNGVCPTGWHLPSNVEWSTLETYVAGPYSSNVSTKLMSVSGWSTDGVTGTDSYGFSALPGGTYNGWLSEYVLIDGYWWTATEYDAKNAYHRNIDYLGEYIDSRPYPKYLGFSVRCIKD